LHEEVLVMDNAKIHTGGGSGLCWDTSLGHDNWW
jgi:hypothetical protein